jgi:hypothetical protein
VVVSVRFNTGNGVGVGPFRFVRNEVGVFVKAPAEGEMPVGVEGAKI